MKVVKSECNAEGNFSVKVYFDYLNPGTKGFKISGNGKLYGTYNQVPAIIEGLKGDCNTSYEFIAKDVEFPDCSAEVNFGKVCCNDKSCSQKLINVTSSECNNIGKYKLNFDLLHYNDKGIGFDLKINGQFHSFHKYSELPLTNIEVLAGVDAYNHIIVCDNDNAHCCDTIEIPNPCKCNIYDVSTQIAECNNADSTYYYRMNFKHTQTSDSFYVAGINDPAKKYAYNKLPIIVGPIKFGFETDILIADKESTLCFAGIEKPGVEGCVSCSIDKIQYEILRCIGEKIYVKFALQTTNPGVKGFSVKGNGIVYRENISYNEKEFYIGPIVPNCDQKYEFIFTDNSNAECKKSIFITEGLCCKSCSISNLKYETFCGIAGNGMQVNFDYTNPNDSLVVLINGIKVGTYKKGNAGITFNYPFVDGKYYAIKIYNQKDINCNLSKEFKFECIQNPCAFEITKFVQGDCNADGSFKLTLGIKSTILNGLQFYVKLNDKLFGPLNYGQESYTFGPIPKVCDVLRIELKDAHNEACKLVVEKEIKICCNENSCSQKLINVTSSECNNLGKYKLNFDLLHYNDKGLGFDLKINGQFHSFHKYSELPLKNIEVLAGIDDYNSIVVCDNHNPHCCDTIEIPNPCKCNIYDVSTQIAECNKVDSTYYYRMNFKHTQTSDSFYVAGITDPAKKYAYNKLPILVGPIKFGVETDILIADKESTLCFTGITKPGVEGCVSCSIDKIQYEILQCIGEKIYVKFTLQTTNPGVKGFSVKGNGIVYRENISYNEKEFYIGPIVPNCDQKYEFIFTDNSNAECKKSIFITEGLCCKSCSISNLKYETFCGIAGNGMQLIFDYTNPNDSLVVLINGIKVGTYKKGNTGITFNYPFVVGKFYALKIYNQKDINCHLATEFKFECVQSPCGFEIIKFEHSECSPDGTFKLTLGIKNNSGNGQQFYANVNGKLFGPLNYGQASYTFGPIPKVCEGLRIELKDAQNEACKLVFEKEIKICCETNSPCNILIKEFVPVCIDGKLTGVKLIVPGKAGEAFKLLLNGVEAGLYKYSDQAFIVKIPEGKDGVYKIKIWDIANPDCFKTFELELSCGGCKIKELSAKAVECTESTFRFLVDFDVINTSDSFMIFQNGIFVGKVHSNQLPILGPVTSKLITIVHKINVIDASKNECQSVLEISKIECISNSTDFTVTELKVYQNERSIVVESNKINVSSLSLFTYDGKLISQNKSKGNIVELDKLPVFGMYILHIELENGERMVRKVVNW